MEATTTTTTKTITAREHAEPVVSVNTPKVYVNTDFSVVVSVGSQWRRSHGITVEELWRAGLTADVVHEGDHTFRAEPCRKCAPTSRTVVELALSGRADFGPFSDPETPGLELFRFDHCRSRCSSSRLHIGSRVVVALHMPHCSGPGAVVYSEPFELLSKKPLSMRGGNLRYSPMPPPRRSASQSSASSSSSSSSSSVNPSPDTVVPQSPEEDEAKKQPSPTAALIEHVPRNPAQQQQQQQQQQQPTPRLCSCFLCGRPVVVTDDVPALPLAFFALPQQYLASQHQ